MNTSTITITIIVVISIIRSISSSTITIIPECPLSELHTSEGIGRLGVGLLVGSSYV